MASHSSVFMADTEALIRQARSITDQAFGKTIIAFTPGSVFPSVSLTGSSCSLHCAHCNHHYLHHMFDASNPESLYQYALNLQDHHGVGILLSGGFTKQGLLPIERFLPVIRQIKKDTQLILEVHTGLVSRHEAESLAAAGVDIACIDMIGHPETIREIYGLPATPADYRQSLLNLTDAGIPTVAPHITIGLHYGLVKGEREALDLLTGIPLSVLIFLILIPTPGTRLAAASPPSVNEAQALIATARHLFPKTPIALGCMRPSGSQRNNYDLAAVDAGVTRIVMPRSATKIQLQKNGYTLIEKQGCCALPAH